MATYRSFCPFFSEYLKQYMYVRTDQAHLAWLLGRGIGSSGVFIVQCFASYQHQAGLPQKFCTSVHKLRVENLNTLCICSDFVVVVVSVSFLKVKAISFKPLAVLIIK